MDAWAPNGARHGIEYRHPLLDRRVLDPARSVNAIPLMRSAIAEVGRELAVRPTAPSRAAYLEMPRLLADLSPDALGGTRKFGKRLHALQFLDF